MGQKQNSPQSQNPSWGTSIGLLAGCSVTLIGVVLDLPPMTILIRAVISGCVVGGVASVVSMSWRLVSPVEDED